MRKLSKDVVWPAHVPDIRSTARAAGGYEIVVTGARQVSGNESDITIFNLPPDNVVHVQSLAFQFHSQTKSLIITVIIV